MISPSLGPMPLVSLLLCVGLSITSAHSQSLPSGDSPLLANKRYVDPPGTPAPVSASPSAPTPHSADTPALYQVQDGYKVDANTLLGFRAWRSGACDRCHGANQEGLVGPSLLNSLKTLSKEAFVTVVRDGRLEKGMQSFGSNKRVMDNIDHLYAYLKGRSDGAITQARVEAMP